MIGSGAMRWTFALAIAAFGCSGGYPDPKPNPPTPPTANDPAYTNRGLQTWYVVGDGAQDGENQMTFIITAPSGTDYVDAYIPGLPPQRMLDQSDGFALDTSIANVAP